jgi:hypothetical protein
MWFLAIGSEKIPMNVSLGSVGRFSAVSAEKIPGEIGKGLVGIFSRIVLVATELARR